MRSIDADALTKEINEMPILSHDPRWVKEAVLFTVDKAPTIRAGRRGRWVVDDVFKTLYRCSRCRGGAPITIEFMSNMLTKFCPYCGAEMENFSLFDMDGE